MTIAIIYLVGVVVAYVSNILLDMMEKIPNTSKNIKENVLWSLLSWFGVYLCVRYYNYYIHKNK